MRKTLLRNQLYIEGNNRIGHIPPKKPVPMDRGCLDPARPEASHSLLVPNTEKASVWLGIELGTHVPGSLPWSPNPSNSKGPAQDLRINSSL